MTIQTKFQEKPSSFRMVCMYLLRCCSAKWKLTDLQLLTFELAVYSAIEAGIKFLNRDEDKTTTNISAS